MKNSEVNTGNLLSLPLFIAFYFNQAAEGMCEKKKKQKNIPILGILIRKWVLSP